MSEKTAIQWAWVPGYQGASWNPIRARLLTDTAKAGWHCEKIRAGCAHCYASALNKRLGTGLNYTYQNRENVEIYLHNVDLPARKKKPHAWFVNSMTDLFGAFVTHGMRQAIFQEMIRNPQHIFILLTKRHQAAHAWISAYYPNLANYPHIWFGGSCEDQDSANQAVAWTLATPAAIRVISYEPAVGPVVWSEAHRNYILMFSDQIGAMPCLDWILIGGESGPEARVCSLDWVRETLRFCKSCKIAAFVKQIGSNPQETGNLLFHYKKGDDMSKWPTDLHVREFPAGPHPEPAEGKQ